ncbi:MAG: hypothetical protein IAE91_01945 [Ignavibacteriaceae bacterium]|nr:hypothetical protein [Ignavibacteriaceae bacterium]
MKENFFLKYLCVLPLLLSLLATGCSGSSTDISKIGDYNSFAERFLQCYFDNDQTTALYLKLSYPAFYQEMKENVETKMEDLSVKPEERQFLSVFYFWSELVGKVKPEENI